MKIFKENHYIDVSPDAYKSMYKRLGYKEVKSKNETSKKAAMLEKNKETEEINETSKKGDVHKK